MDLLFVILTIVVANLAIYYFFLHNLSLFKRLGVPHVRGLPLIGNMGSLILLRKSLPEIVTDIYNKFPDAKYFGVFEFSKPVIVLRDPALVAAVTVKNFDNFVDHRPMVISEKDILLKANLFRLNGNEWRDLRKIVSPSFTSSKMKMMFNLIQDSALNFVNFVESKSKNGWSMDVKAILLKYTCDAVASSAFGFQVDSMKDPTNDFYTTIRNSLQFEGKLTQKLLLGRSLPWIIKLFNVRLFDEKTTNFFVNVMRENVKMRTDSALYRPDLIQLMLESKDKANFTIEDMTSQAFVFFWAGSESVASLLCFFVHEMAVNPEIQAKLRREIDETTKDSDGRVSYDCVMHLKYLDAAVNEILRLYPLSAFVDRLCVKEYQLPAVTPDGKSVTLKPGDSVWIPTYALHRDPKYFPDPEKFDPERFIDTNVDQSFYLPFGAGPRICVGSRYALMLVKVVLFHLFARCEVEVCDRTSVPLVLNPNTFLMSSKNGFWLKIKARDAKPMSNGVKSSG